MTAVHSLSGGSGRVPSSRGGQEGGAAEVGVRKPHLRLFSSSSLGSEQGRLCRCGARRRPRGGGRIGVSAKSTIPRPAARKARQDPTSVDGSGCLLSPGCWPGDFCPCFLPCSADLLWLSAAPRVGQTKVPPRQRSYRGGAGASVSAFPRGMPRSTRKDARVCVRPPQRSFQFRPAPRFCLVRCAIKEKSEPARRCVVKPAGRAQRGMPRF